MVVFVCKRLKDGKENVNNMTEFSFSNAKMHQTSLKRELKARLTNC